jgi:hypothetical protein
MADPRLDSVHLGFLPRRQDYRRARQALLGERGWMTLGAEQLRGFLGGGDDSEALLQPEQILPGTKFLLVDHEAGDTYPLRTGLNTVGRLPNNDIVFAPLEVSRRHCVLLVHARGGCELHDTASLNGTSVNGNRVKHQVRLNSGDWIQLPKKLLLFVSEKDYLAGDEDDDHPDTIPG